jgi:hypothetical protein
MSWAIVVASERFLMKRIFLSLTLTVAVALVTIEASAFVINVANPSFERN